ncbi:MAG TPA: hypothetical protein VFQ90_00410, partial [Stellaceae bacterium]|nr:hypothetical protein [Stellaceae bacterium]
MPPRRPREDGIALLLVLWVMALLTVVGFSLARGVDTRAKIDRNQYDLARAQALADTGVSLAVLGVLGNLPGGRWRLDGSPRELANADGTLVVRVQSEAGKIDLNHAGTDLLANLFRTTGVDGDAAEALAIAIAGWENHRRAQWRQRAEETANAPSIGAVQPFLAVEELREIPGLTREIYDRVSPYLTIYSGVARVDPL